MNLQFKGLTHLASDTAITCGSSPLPVLARRYLVDDMKLNLSDARKFLSTSLDEPKLKELPPKIKEYKSRKDCAWVLAARNIVMDHLETEFSKLFNTSPDEYLRMEGIKAISPVWREPKYLGSGMYPDGAIEVGDQAIAIQLDHGSKGSHIRNSLAKAAFSVQVSKYSEAHVLYFWEKDEFPRRDKQVDKVLFDFSSNSETYLHLIK